MDRADRHKVVLIRYHCHIFIGFLEIECFRCSDSGVIVGQPEVAVVLAGFRIHNAPAPFAAVREFLFFGAPAVLHKPCTISLRSRGFKRFRFIQIANLMPEIFLRVIVIPSYHADRMTRPHEIVGIVSKIAVDIVTGFYLSRQVGVGPIGDLYCTLLHKLLLDRHRGSLVVVIGIAVISHFNISRSRKHV